MIRLLALAGETVRTKSCAFTLTAYDPASGLYIGMGHSAGPDADALIGQVPSVALLSEGVSTCAENLACVAYRSTPALGPIARQNVFGVCGKLRRRLQRGVMATAKAEKGPAYILTTAVTREELNRLAEASVGVPLNLRAIPIEITDTSGGGVGFHFTGFEVLHGMSGSPIVQHGHLVGAVYGQKAIGSKTMLGRDIEQMVTHLLESGAGKMSKPGQSGKHRNRAAQSKRQVRAFRAKARMQQHEQVRGMAQQEAARCRALADKGRKLETLIHQYEAGNGDRQSYLAALEQLWACQSEANALIVKSWMTTGRITKGEYRAILESVKYDQT